MFIQLKSSDSEIFTIDIAVCRMSGTLRNLLDNFGVQEEEDSEPVPIPNVTGAILKKVLTWAEHYKDRPMLADENDDDEGNSDGIPTWDAEFFKVEQNVLFEIILAANYLDVKGLLEVACKTVANMIRGKSPEEIRKTFGIVNDFTADEEERHKREVEWCEDKSKM